MVNNLINDFRRKKHIQNVSYLSRLKKIIVEGFDEEFFIHNVQLFQPRTTRQSVGVGIGRKGIGVGTSKSFHSSTDQTIVDSGRLSINQKGLRFIGTTKQLGWDWKKIVEIQIHQNKLVIPVSNRQNISGVVLPLKPDVVKIIGTWLVDFANGDEISELQLSEPQEIDIMSKKNLVIAAMTIFCLLTIAVINPSTLQHDMDGRFRIETNCSSVSIDLEYPGERYFYHNDRIDIDGGTWTLDYTFDSSEINEYNINYNLQIDVFCSRSNVPDDSDPYLMIETILNGNRLAINSDTTTGVGVSCDHEFSVDSDGTYERHYTGC